MKKGVFFCSLPLFLIFLLPPQAFGQKKDSTSYIENMHKQIGRKHALRRTGPDWIMYTTHLAGPEFGMAEISPRDEVIAGNIGTWTITYTVGKAGLGLDDAINVYIPFGFNPPKLHHHTYYVENKKLSVLPSYPKDHFYEHYAVASDGFTNGFTTVTTTNPNTQVFAYSNVRDASRISEGSKIYVWIQGEPLKEGNQIVLTYGDTRFGSLGSGSPYFAQIFEFATFYLQNVNWAKFEEMIDNIDRQRARLYTAAEKTLCLQNQPALRVIGGEATQLALTIPSLAKVNESFDLHVLAMDKLQNESEYYEGELCFESADNIAVPASIRVKKENHGFIRIREGGKISQPGIYRLVVRDKEKSLRALSNPIKILSEEPNEKIFWGDLHVHSFESDGLGTPDWCNKFARDIAALDFCCICDHAVGVFDKIRESAIKFSEPGRFISFSGFEGFWLPNEGHINFYFVDHSPDYEHVLKHIEKDGSGRREITKREFWDHLLSYGDKKVIAVPHNHQGGTWDEMDNRVARLNEVYSIWGNSEYNGTSERRYLPIGKNEFTKRNFQDALAAKLKLGAIASGDEHSGRAGKGKWDRYHASNSAGLVAVHAKELSHEGIFEGLWDRHVYGTTGARIVVDYSINGYPMGSEIFTSHPNEKRSIYVHIEGTDDIEYVALIKNNIEFMKKDGSGKSMSIEITDETPIKDTDYYYVRVVQKDTHIAWSSPIWVSVK